MYDPQSTFKEGGKWTVKLNVGPEDLWNFWALYRHQHNIDWPVWLSISVSFWYLGQILIRRVTATAVGTFSAELAILMFATADWAVQVTSAMVCHVTIAITFERPQWPWNILFYTEQHVTKFDLTRKVSSSELQKYWFGLCHLRGVFTFVSKTYHWLNPLPCKACQNVIHRDIQRHVINNASCTCRFTWTRYDLDCNDTICQLRTTEKRSHLLHAATIYKSDFRYTKEDKPCTNPYTSRNFWIYTGL